VEDRDRLSSLVTQGRRLYGIGRYAEAAARFNQALDEDPENELAQSYLELTEERLRTTRAQPREVRDTRPRTGQGATSPLPLVQARPTPSTARLTLFFNSPINAGSVLVTVDGQTVADIAFDFTDKGLLGIKRKGTGKVKRVLLSPSGRHTVGVELRDPERGSLGAASFTEVLPGGSDWTLRIDLPSKKAPEASFYLVRATG